ncbi:uncharacterized protein LOC106168184 [Lingula anatina]|uniref:Uncharacterized protein LOC106168184 n=1 Tax=Lingula anatina TaxID=7574 RepID=A0A1S3IXP1_LINAN|nr:uncharacterized protein LOC106168184 [Lingula anatina]XP_013402722.1 uncharacterized protein LOC106168184 [Lingula anatina]XP_013402798.1 uncharacterized protein LOC106168184 [Lingula anatina]|eukprot:XP_013402639.1 uncharacterized protein LOC106168184 [Lingula anatina]
MKIIPEQGQEDHSVAVDVMDSQGDASFLSEENNEMERIHQSLLQACESESAEDETDDGEGKREGCDTTMILDDQDIEQLIKDLIRISHEEFMKSRQDQEQMVAEIVDMCENSSLDKLNLSTYSLQETLESATDKLIPLPQIAELESEPSYTPGKKLSAIDLREVTTFTDAVRDDKSPSCLDTVTSETASDTENKFSVMETADTEEVKPAANLSSPAPCAEAFSGGSTINPSFQQSKSEVPSLSQLVKEACYSGEEVCNLPPSRGEAVEIMEAGLILPDANVPEAEMPCITLKGGPLMSTPRTNKFQKNNKDPFSPIIAFPSCTKGIDTSTPGRFKGVEKVRHFKEFKAYSDGEDEEEESEPATAGRKILKAKRQIQLLPSSNLDGNIMQSAGDNTGVTLPQSKKIIPNEDDTLGKLTEQSEEQRDFKGDKDDVNLSVLERMRFCLLQQIQDINNSEPDEAFESHTLCAEQALKTKTTDTTEQIVKKIESKSSFILSLQSAEFLPSVSGDSNANKSKVGEKPGENKAEQNISTEENKLADTKVIPSHTKQNMIKEPEIQELDIATKETRCIIPERCQTHSNDLTLQHDAKTKVVQDGKKTKFISHCATSVKDVPVIYVSGLKVKEQPVEKDASLPFSQIVKDIKQDTREPPAPVVFSDMVPDTCTSQNNNIKIAQEITPLPNNILPVGSQTPVEEAEISAADKAFPLEKDSIPVLGEPGQSSDEGQRETSIPVAKKTKERICISPIRYPTTLNEVTNKSVKTDSSSYKRDSCSQGKQKSKVQERPKNTSFEKEQKKVMLDTKENQRMKEVKARWKSKGIPSPEVNLTCASYWRKRTKASTSKSGLLEGSSLHSIPSVKIPNKLKRKRKEDSTMEDTTKYKKPRIEEAKGSDPYELKEKVGQQLDELKSQLNSTINKIMTDFQSEKYKLEMEHIYQYQHLVMKQKTEIMGYMSNQAATRHLNCEHSFLLHNLRRGQKREMSELDTKYRGKIKEKEASYQRQKAAIKEILKLQTQQTNNVVGSLYVPVSFSSKCSNVAEHVSLLPAGIAEEMIAEDVLYDRFYKHE